MSPEDTAETFFNGNRSDAVAEVVAIPTKLGAVAFALKVAGYMTDEERRSWLRAIEARA